MAAETAVDRGLSVTVVDAKPSFGRKFLMAGKSGLNLTKDEPLDAVINAYGDAAEWMQPLIKEFDNASVMSWAQDLGQPIFTGSSGRVFPKEMKASPLLRAWLLRLTEKGVQFHRSWQWSGWEDDRLIFQTAEGCQFIENQATVLALGGASWARLGSNGTWADILADQGIALAPFEPANMGFVVDWSEYMTPHFGQPVKSVRLTAGKFTTLGEFVISSKGIEGSGIYAASKAMRDGSPLVLDLLPDVDIQVLMERILKLPKKASRATVLRKALKLDGVKAALFNEFARSATLGDVPKLAKALPISHDGPRPLDEAISTAGGVPRDALDERLMLKSKPGVFCAGEMLDWEAPTGGYLITGCLATGRWAGNGAADFVVSSRGH
jgi:uncharacterized flavoprotein (TIGR03862 family)